MMRPTLLLLCVLLCTEISTLPTERPVSTLPAAENDFGKDDFEINDYIPKHKKKHIAQSLGSINPKKLDALFEDVHEDATAQSQKQPSAIKVNPNMEIEQSSQNLKESEAHTGINEENKNEIVRLSHNTGEETSQPQQQVTQSAQEPVQPVQQPVQPVQEPVQSVHQSVQAVQPVQPAQQPAQPAQPVPSTEQLVTQPVPSSVERNEAPSSSSDVSAATNVESLSPSAVEKETAKNSATQQHVEASNSDKAPPKYSATKQTENHTENDAAILDKAPPKNSAPIPQAEKQPDHSPSVTDKPPPKTSASIPQTENHVHPDASPNKSFVVTSTEIHSEQGAPETPKAAPQTESEPSVTDKAPPKAAAATAVETPKNVAPAVVEIPPTSEPVHRSETAVPSTSSVSKAESAGPAPDQTSPTQSVSSPNTSSQSAVATKSESINDPVAVPQPNPSTINQESDLTKKDEATVVNKNAPESHSDSVSAALPETAQISNEQREKTHSKSTNSHAYTPEKSVEALAAKTNTQEVAEVQEEKAHPHHPKHHSQQKHKQPIIIVPPSSKSNILVDSVNGVTTIRIEENLGFDDDDDSSL